MGRMAVMQPPGQLEELEHSDERLLQELQRMDELLLEELERVDELLQRIVNGIDQLPERVVSAVGREHLGPLPGAATGAAEPAGSLAPARSFDPYRTDEVVVPVAKDEKSAVRRAAGKVQSWVAARAPDGDAFGLATVSLAVSSVATAIAVVALIVAVLH